MMYFFHYCVCSNASDIEVVNKRIQSVIEKYTSTGFYNFICEYSAIPLVNYHLESLDTVKRLVIYGFLGFGYFLCCYHELYADCYCCHESSS